MRDSVMGEVVHIGLAASLFILLVKFAAAKLAAWHILPAALANVLGML